jgi:dTMP kinase
LSGRGRFITFEGGEGAGKSAQSRHLVAKLAELGVETVATREPGGTPHAERLRELILSGGLRSLGPAAEALAFSAARIDHIDALIAPALDRGAWVVSDRFIDSTRAYQGVAGDLDPDFITRLEQVAVGECRPDLTLVLDLPPEEGLARATARRGATDRADRFEGEGLQFHRTLRAAFLALARHEPSRCVVIDAASDEANVSQAVWTAVRERLGDYLPGSRA